MCDKCGCSKPEKLKDEPEKCTAEQIEECHPEADAHPCEEKGKEEQEQEPKCGS